ncbi:MAG TPA: hypothetical protein VIK53_06490 [Verrucomicrobiae bacterium]
MQKKDKKHRRPGRPAVFRFNGAFPNFSSHRKEALISMQNELHHPGNSWAHHLEKPADADLTEKLKERKWSGR